MTKFHRFVDFAFLFFAVAICFGGIGSVVRNVYGQTYNTATISGATCYTTQCQTCAAYMSSSGTCYVTNSTNSDGSTYLGCQVNSEAAEPCDQSGVEGQKSTCGAGTQWVCQNPTNRSCDVSDCSCSGEGGLDSNPMLSAQCST